MAELDELRAPHRGGGPALRERLPVYPEHLLEQPGALRARACASAALRRADADGWRSARRRAMPRWRQHDVSTRLLARRERPAGARASSARSTGRELARRRRRRRCSARRARDLHALSARADARARDDVGDEVTYVVNRNINFTNVCFVGCTLLRLLAPQATRPTPTTTRWRRCSARRRDAVARGATEVCIQGGINPDKDRFALPRLLRRDQGASSRTCTSTRSRRGDHVRRTAERHGAPATTSRWLRDAGLGTIPGTAAEILDDEVREILSPRKLKTRALGRDHHDRARARPALDLDGHVRPHREARATSAGHLDLLRDIQKQTGGFTEFVPLGFIHEQATRSQPARARAPARRCPRTCA